MHLAPVFSRHSNAYRSLLAIPGLLSFAQRVVTAALMPFSDTTFTALGNRSGPFSIQLVIALEESAHFLSLGEKVLRPCQPHTAAR